MQELTKQYWVSVAAGKRLIAKAVLELPQLKQALRENTVVITAGTTNGYLAEEVLDHLGQKEGFSIQRFYRGITLPPDYETFMEAKGETFLGDIVIKAGKWEQGLTLADVVDELVQGDLIIKGANAVNLQEQEAAVMVGDLKAGTIGRALPAVIGRRVELLLPVGLEKRVISSIGKIVRRVNSADASGPRLFPVRGTIITELEAVRILSGAEADLIAAGGVSGAEGSYRLAVTGTEAQLQMVDVLMAEIVNEPQLIL